MLSGEPHSEALGDDWMTTGTPARRPYDARRRAGPVPTVLTCELENCGPRKIGELLSIAKIWSISRRGPDMAEGDGDVLLPALQSESGPMRLAKF
jgi:hypothetical protein